MQTDEIDKHATLIIESPVDQETLNLLYEKKYKRIVLGYGDFSDCSWLLPYAENIESLNSLGGAVDARLIARLRNLVNLDLGLTVGEVDFTLLTSLQRLNITWQRRYPVSILALPLLRKLLVTGWPHHDVKHLVQIPSLEDCSLRQGSLQNLDGIAELRRLSRLDLHYCRKLVSLASISGAKDLIEFSLRNAPQLTEIGGLAELPSLQKLTLEALPSIRDLDLLFGLRSLRVLDVKNVAQNAEVSSLSWLSGLPHLEWLTLTNPVQHVDWELVLSQKNLKNIWIAYAGGNDDPFKCVSELAEKYGKKIVYQSGSHHRGRRSYHDLKLEPQAECDLSRYFRPNSNL